MPRFRIVPILAVACLSLIAQTPPPAQEPTSGLVIRKNVQEVLLDLVVRDKREKMVSDLKPEDLEVYEDGAKQSLRTFRFVSGAEVRAAEDKAAAGTAKINPLRQLNLVLIVFRMLGAQDRLAAKLAAEEFLKTELRPNTYIGVFSLDYKLNALQQFTNNLPALKKAVNTASTGAYKEFAKTSEAVFNASELAVSGGRGGIVVSGGAIDSTSPSAGVVTADMAATDGANVMRAILAAERRTFSGIEGMREIDALKLMVQQLGVMPGRKTVLMLSTGLQKPAEQDEVFQSLIGNANRFNVSIYSVDVRGLTTYSATWANRAGVNATAAISGTQGNKGAVTGAQATQDDLLQYSLKGANQQDALAELSEATGGFLISGNDLHKPLTRIMEDVNTHYELAYAPTSEIYDGHFRRIDVKLKRPGLHLQSRNGYFALPDLNGKPIDTFEIAALKALDTKPMPREFEFHVSALRFRPNNGVWQQSLTFELPIAVLQPTPLENPARKRLHPTFFAMIKDASGQIVEKLSRDIPYTIPDDKFEGFKAGNIIVTQPFSLPPGRYTIESAIIDRESNKASTRRSLLMLPEPKAVSLSSISLVRRLDPLKEAPDPLDPFQFPGTKVTPTLASAVVKGAQPSIYFVIYPSKTSAEKPKVTVQYFLDGKEIGRQVPEVTDQMKDSTGAIPMLAAAKLQPGQYEVRVTVMQGAEGAQQAMSFAVEN